MFLVAVAECATLPVHIKPVFTEFNAVAGQADDPFHPHISSIVGIVKKDDVTALRLLPLHDLLLPEGKVESPSQLVDKDARIDFMVRQHGAGGDPSDVDDAGANQCNTDKKNKQPEHDVTGLFCGFGRYRLDRHEQ